MSDCSKHKKEVLGCADMRELATMIGDLHYETLAKFMEELELKIYTDSRMDNAKGKLMLSQQLGFAAGNLMKAHANILKAWQISKPFMK